VDGRGEEPDVGVAAREVPLDPPDEVVGGRLDLVVVAGTARHVDDGGPLTGGERVQYTH